MYSLHQTLIRISGRHQQHGHHPVRTIARAAPALLRGTAKCSRLPSPTFLSGRLGSTTIAHVSRTLPAPVETIDTEQLVEHLLARTRRLMDGKIWNNDDNNNNDASPATYHSIAFSGGVDSSLAAYLVHQARRQGECVQAVLGLSPAVPAEQVQLAASVADIIGIPLTKVVTTEGTDNMYIANAGQACYACKTHLYTTLQSIYAHVEQHADAAKGTRGRSDVAPPLSRQYLYNGTNADDVHDSTRVGLLAAERFQVLSPLRHLTKAQVRTVARYVGLPNWDYAAAPCLRSRLATGVPATVAHLQRVDRAERHVRWVLALPATHNLRVRLLAGNCGCIEVDDHVLDQAQRVDWSHVFIHRLQFASVKVRAFRSGSVAQSLGHQHEGATSQLVDKNVRDTEDEDDAYRKEQMAI